MSWPDIKCPIESLESCVACHSRDWSVHHRDAWLWGIICGWGNAWDEIEKMALAATVCYAAFIFLCVAIIFIH